MTNRVPRLPEITTQRLIAALALLLFGYFFLIGISAFAFLSLYLLFVVITIFVVRGVPVQPGQWLARRAVRRALVVGISLACLLTLAQTGPESPGGAFLMPALFVLGFLALGRATQRVTSAPDSQVDERQEALRNRAYRLAYWILALTTAASVLTSYMLGGSPRAWLLNALHSGPLSVFFILLFFLPAMVLAWLEPDGPGADDAPRRSATPGSRLAVGMVAISLVIPVALSLTLLAGPARTTSSVVPQSAVDPGMTCAEFQATRQVGTGFGASIPIHAVACWDGQRASEVWGLNASDCHPNRTEESTVETVECSRTIDRDGTLRFVYRARVRSAIIPFVTRDSVMSLVLTRDGRVVRFP